MIFKLAFEARVQYIHTMRNDLDIPLTFAMAIILTVVMLWPSDQLSIAKYGNDKLIHFIAFATLAFPLARTGRFRLFLVLIGASTFGSIIELAQPSFNRSASVSDWIADTLGAFLGIVCGLLYRRLRRH